MANPAPKKSTAKAAPAAKRVVNPVATKAVAKKVVAKKAAPATAAAAKKAPAKATAANKHPAKQAPVTKTPAKGAPAPAKKAAAPAKKASPFDVKFLEGQRELLIEERAKLLGQADRLEGEAAALMENLDPGDVQFDDESGEGDSLVVERERDLALSAQARQMISDIDLALRRIGDGSYGLSVISGRPIPKERLRAIPWAKELVEEKVGGLGTRR